MDTRAYADRGFTLIELMIVLAIASIVITIGTFTYISQVQLIKLRNDVRELNQSLQAARMRTLAAGVGHGVIFDTDNGRYAIFVDCNNDEEFTDSDSNYSNNTPVATAEECAASAYDPLMDAYSIHQLDSRNRIESIPGSQDYIVFNNLGQSVQGNTPVFGDIVIRGTPEDGLVDQAIIHLSASGISDLLPISRVAE